MSEVSLDPRFQTLFHLLQSEIGSLKSEVMSEMGSLKSEIGSLKSEITVMNNSIGRLHEKMDSHIIFYRGFIEDTRNRLDTLERKTA